MAGNTLGDLGDCEAVISRLERERARLPEAIATAESRAQEARDVLQAERDALADLEKERRAKEGEVQDVESQRAKFQSQSAVVKTNQEYHALLREIDGAGERIAALEESILVAMERIDEAGARLADVEKEQTQIERSFLEQAEAHKAKLADVERELVVRTEERSRILDELGDAVKLRYERVAKVRGTGVARLLANNTCEACHRAVPPEVRNRVLAGELHACANCSRILVTSSEDV